MNTNDVTDVNSALYEGSLRWALAQANAIGSPALIEFALPSCPSVITLNSPLPIIWVPLMIDGYSTPGALPNSDPGNLSNATLCVAIKPASSITTPVGLIVPSGAHEVSLRVRGMAFGNFSTGIQVWGGHDHQIVGNQFGGLLNGFQLYGFDTAAIWLEGSTPAIIGGSNPADRNVFLNANSFVGANAAGVLVGATTNNAHLDCQIVGNLFGVTPDGSSAVQTNENGILLKGSGCAVLGNYLAGNTKDAIRLVGASHNVVQNNIIGPAPSFGLDFYNPGAGIRVSENANDNIIGAGDGYYGPVYSYQNVITDMDAGGIIVSDSTGNTIRGNAIYGNGLSTGLNVDLGSDGPTQNDPRDVDSGSNDLMNFPVPHAVAWTTGGPPQFGFVSLTVEGTLDVPPGYYDIDAYYDVDCSPTGRGGGTWVGSALYIGYGPGVGGFEVPVEIPFFGFDSAHGRLSLTATADDGHRSTSEFSRCLSVDTIFSDAFDF